MTPSIGMLSTYPPTQCGLATFAQALTAQLVASGTPVGIVRVVDRTEPGDSLVAHQWVRSERGAARGAAAALNAGDLAIVQHEYGIFGGRDGADVVELLAQVRVPVISVLHTVLTEPTAHQHRVLAGVIDASAAVVTMTETARQRLLHGWDVDPELATVIAHGAQDNRSEGHRPSPGAPPTLLTWGLLGEGKGIEWAIEAMAGLTDLRPRPLYRVVGQTHPRVLERDGEAYRDRLTAQAQSSGIADLVDFDARYLDGPSLRRIVRDADVIVLPYDSRDQVTSGVLTEAVVAGKPVVSTRFPHAVELLSSGAGLLVPQRDPDALRSALLRVLSEPELAASMAAESRRLAPSLLWPAVAEEYLALADLVLADDLRATSVAAAGVGSVA